MTAWTTQLVSECRNRKCVPFAAMSKNARLLMIGAHFEGHVQIAYGISWLSDQSPPLCAENAYRINPSWNPMNQKTNTGATK